MTDADCPPGTPVIVVGAGVAGLTTAHELIARGYEVHVVERVDHKTLGRGEDLFATEGGPEVAEDKLQLPAGVQPLDLHDEHKPKKLVPPWVGGVAASLPIRVKPCTTGSSHRPEDVGTVAAASRFSATQAVAVLRPPTEELPASAFKVAGAAGWAPWERLFFQTEAAFLRQAAEWDEDKGFPDQSFKAARVIASRAGYTGLEPLTSKPALTQRQVPPHELRDFRRTVLKFLLATGAFPDAPAGLAEGHREDISALDDACPTWIGRLPTTVERTEAWATEQRPSAPFTGISLAAAPGIARWLRNGLVASQGDARVHFHVQIPDGLETHLSAVRKTVRALEAKLRGDTRIGRHWRDPATLTVETVPSATFSNPLQVMLINIAVEEVDARGNPIGYLPGEHGYRFFPSFYAHVFDTMRRTPSRTVEPRTGELGDPGDPFDRTPDRVVFDDLISMEDQAWAFEDGREPVLITRGRATSLHEVLQTLRMTQERLGFELSDVVRLQERYLRYLTTGPRRRRDLEDVTWSDYLGSGRFSEGFQFMLSHWPRALVGLESDRADARTFGSVSAQLLLDQVADRGVRDATLNGPTSAAWFEPWRRHLEDLGVCFHQDACLALALHRPKGATGTDTIRVRPVFERLGYRDALPGGFYDPSLVAPVASGTWWLHDGLAQSARDDTSRLARKPVDCVLPADAYVVLAVSPMEASRLSETLASATSPVPNGAQDLPTASRDRLTQAVASSDLGRTLRLLRPRGGSPFRPTAAVPAEPGDGLPLAHFTGIQFFPSRNDPIERAHVYFAATPWALTAISQQQVWNRRSRLPERRGVISVDVGDVGKPAMVYHRTADSAVDPIRREVTFWESTRGEAAQASWQAITRALDRPSHTHPQGNVLFHVDEGIVYGLIPVGEEGRDPRPVWLRPIPSLSSLTSGDAWDLLGTPWVLEPDGGLLTTSGPRNGDGDDAHRPLFDNTPYLLNAVVDGVGLHASWPGDLDASVPDRGYDVVLGNLVFAGSYCRTFTRLVTMEAANESGRHAANAIIRHRAEQGDYSGPPARIWPLEEREPADLSFWKTLDDRLHAEGLPHLFDVIEVEPLLEELLRSKDTGDAHRALDKLDEMVRAFLGRRPDLRSVSSFITPTLLGSMLSLMSGAGGRRSGGRG